MVAKEVSIYLQASAVFQNTYDGSDSKHLLADTAEVVRQNFLFRLREVFRVLQISDQSHRN